MRTTKRADPDNICPYKEKSQPDPALLNPFQSGIQNRNISTKSKLTLDFDY